MTAAYPESATKFRRLLGRRTPSPEELESRIKGFELLCKSLGLQPADQAQAPRPKRAPQATQLALFGT